MSVVWKRLSDIFFSQIHINTAAGFGFQNWNAGNETGSANAEISFTFVEKRHHSIFVSSIYAHLKKVYSILKVEFFFMIWSVKKCEFKLFPRQHFNFQTARIIKNQDTFLKNENKIFKIENCGHSDPC